MNVTKALLIDDDPVLGKVLTHGLAQSGINCVHVASYEQASSLLENHFDRGNKPAPPKTRKKTGGTDIDVVVLDYYLDEGKTGLPLCKKIRMNTQIPVVMLTGEKSLKTTIKCLEEGADQYICKPFELEELVARIKASIRARKSARVVKPAKTDISICINNQELEFGNSKAALTEKESLLAEILIRNTGCAVTKAELQDHVYGRFTGDYSRSLDMLVVRLRKKLAITGGRCRILSARNLGYKFVVRKNV